MTGVCTRPLTGLGDSLADLDVVVDGVQDVVIAWGAHSTPVYHGPNRALAKINWASGWHVIAVGSTHGPELRRYHGAFLAASWLGIVVVTVFVARYLRNHGQWAMKVHYGLNTLVLVISAVAVGLAVKAWGSGSGADTSPHAVIGYLICVALILHVLTIGSFLSGSRWAHIAHRVLGFGLLAAAWVNVGLGITKLGLPSGATSLFALWSCEVTAIFALAEINHRMAKAGGEYTPLASAPPAVGAGSGTFLGAAGAEAGEFAAPSAPTPLLAAETAANALPARTSAKINPAGSTGAVPSTTKRAWGETPSTHGAPAITPGGRPAPGRVGMIGAVLHRVLAQTGPAERALALLGLLLFSILIFASASSSLLAGNLARIAPAAVATTSSNANLRTFYVQAENVRWSYTPLGSNMLAGGRPFTEEELAILGGADATFKKVAYFEYTDATFKRRKVTAPETGLISVVLRAEVGDTMQIVFRNRGDVAFSLHPHGVFYDKASEGANDYNDATPRNAQDRVEPGQTAVYVWPVPERSGPGPGDGSSINWLFHSHIREDVDVAMGLVGFMVVYRKGMLDPVRHRAKDLDREYTLYWQSFEEQLSLYSGDSHVYRKDIDDAMPVVRHAVNGLSFGNLPALEMRVGERVRLHMASLGNEVDLHAPAIRGAAFVFRGTRVSSITVIPGMMVPVDVYPEQEGTFSIDCLVGEHHAGGMSALIKVLPAAPPSTAGGPSSTSAPAEEPGVEAGSSPEPTRVRAYFLAASESVWNYAPYGVGRSSAWPAGGAPAPGTEAGDKLYTSPLRAGSRYIKARYHAFADATFASPLPRPAEWRHLGLLGPALEAVVGDTLQVTLFNNCSLPVNIVPDGLILGPQPVELVAPGARVTYTWTVPVGAGPADAGSDAEVLWLYGARDIAADAASRAFLHDGLVGPLIVRARGPLTSRRRVPDRRFVLVFFKADENLSPFLARNVAQFVPSASTVRLDDPGFVESNIKPCVNGLMVANLDGIEFAAGESVSIMFAGLGSAGDLHGVAIQGHTGTVSGLASPGVAILPGSSINLLLSPAVTGRPFGAGTFLIACETLTHSAVGMAAPYTVRPSAAQAAAEAVLLAAPALSRRYIRAEEVEWDFTPNQRNMNLNEPFSSEHGLAFFERGPYRIGNRVRKWRYVEYADAAFTLPLPGDADPRWAHRGILGPVLRGHVGAVLEVVLANGLPEPVNLFVTGVSSASDAAVPVAPGSQTTYRLHLPNAMGSADFSSMAFPYHSTVNLHRHTMAGLVGILIEDALPLGPDGLPPGVAREFVSAYVIFDENQSPLLGKNIALYTARPGSVEVHNEDFVESNVKHSVNGLMFGNYLHNATYEMLQSERVRWYFFAYGSQLDLHSGHYHGDTFISNRGRADVIEVFPATTRSADMVTDNPGIFLFHCHIADHIVAGMVGRFAIVSKLGTLVESDEQDWQQKKNNY